MVKTTFEEEWPINKLVIIGFLGRDPETRTISTGKTVCSFSVAVSNQHDREKTQWFRVSAWEKLGDNCQRYLAKGSKVAVVGPVSVSSYEAKDGSTRFSLDVRADDVEFLEKSDKSASCDTKTAVVAHSQNDVFDETLPF